MADTTDISDAIAENATGPKRVQGDSGSVEQHSIPDQIAADDHLAKKAASAKPHQGMRLVRQIPPGTV